MSYPRIRIYGFAYFCARLYTTHYYTEINPNSGGLLWPVSEKRIMPCRMYSVQLLSVQAELLLQLHIKTGIFDQPTLSGAKWTPHFLQYARRTHARISSSWHACMNEPSNRHAWIEWTGMYADCCCDAAAAAGKCRLLPAARARPFFPCPLSSNISIRILIFDPPRLS